MAVGGALFGGGRGSAAAKTSLVEFRAGKMTLGSDNMVTPDKRKGLIIVDQADDQLMHFKALALVPLAHQLELYKEPRTKWEGGLSFYSFLAALFHVHVYDRAYYRVEATQGTLAWK